MSERDNHYFLSWFDSCYLSLDPFQSEHMLSCLLLPINKQHCHTWRTAKQVGASLILFSRHPITKSNCWAVQFISYFFLHHCLNLYHIFCMNLIHSRPLAGIFVCPSLIFQRYHCLCFLSVFNWSGYVTPVFKALCNLPLLSGEGLEWPIFLPMKIVL